MSRSVGLSKTVLFISGSPLADSNGGLVDDHTIEIYTGWPLTGVEVRYDVRSTG